jgi:suppressor for copper-sensitivity B
MKKIFTIFILFFVFALPAAAENTAAGEYASARFISGDENVDKKLPTDMGLDIILKDGWYTYWRMPGDNGLAPKFDWTGSTNVKSVDVSWPAPSRFTVMDMHSFGYSDHVLLPLQITPKNAELPTKLDVKIDMVVCHEICIPESLHVTGDVVSAEKEILSSAKKSLPLTDNSDDLGITAAVLGKEALVITAYAKGGFHTDADVIVETPLPLLTIPPQILIDEKNPDQAVLKLVAPAGMDLTKELFGKEAVILLLHGGKAIEKKFTF